MLSLDLELKPSRYLQAVLISCLLLLAGLFCLWPINIVLKIIILFVFGFLSISLIKRVCLADYALFNFLSFDEGCWFIYSDEAKLSAARDLQQASHEYQKIVNSKQHALTLLASSRVLGAFVFLNFKYDAKLSAAIARQHRRALENNYIAMFKTFFKTIAPTKNKKLSFVLMHDSMSAEQWSNLRRWMLLRGSSLLNEKD